MNHFSNARRSPLFEIHKYNRVPGPGDSRRGIGIQGGRRRGHIHEVSSVRRHSQSSLARMTRYRS